LPAVLLGAVFLPHGLIVDVCRNLRPNIRRLDDNISVRCPPDLEKINQGPPLGIIGLDFCNSFDLSFARAVAARSTCIKYSLSPLVSPSFGLTGLAGSSSEDIAEMISLCLKPVRQLPGGFRLHG
jgi:hypothetical protein